MNFIVKIVYKSSAVFEGRFSKFIYEKNAEILQGKFNYMERERNELMRELQRRDEGGKHKCTPECAL